MRIICHEVIPLRDNRYNFRTEQETFRHGKSIAEKRMIIVFVDKPSVEIADCFDTVSVFFSRSRKKPFVVVDLFPEGNVCKAGVVLDLGRMITKADLEDFNDRAVMPTVMHPCIFHEIQQFSSDIGILVFDIGISKTAVM